MPDVATLTGLLLVLGPVVGLIPVAHPALIPIWSMDRAGHLATVGAHRAAWAWLNAGFVLSTVATAAGLLILPAAIGGEPGRQAALTAAAAGYAIGGGLWCAVLAIRARTTPILADLVATGTPTEPAETVLGAATGGLFAAFMLVSCVAVLALGATLAVAGGIALPVAALVILVAAALLVAQLATGDAIPAILYLPTLAIGVALLAGWS